MEFDTPTPKYSTGDPTSFGYPTARERWPIIITNVIDDVYRSTFECEQQAKQEEGKKIVEELARLKYELQHNRKLVYSSSPAEPIRDDGYQDVQVYNKELEQLGEPSWMNMPWLFCEGYLFRRLHTSFSLSTYWKSYDAFSRQKISSFRASRVAVLELARYYEGLLDQVCDGKTNRLDAETEKMLFIEMCEISLWGNATDLSLLTNLTYDNIQKLQGSEARKAAEANVLVNDLAAAYELLCGPAKADMKERRVDIVLDNAGFELFVDLVLAGFLIATGLATVVVFHPKSMPWFVSDVIPADFASLLSALAKPREFWEEQTEEDRAQNKPPVTLSETEVADLSRLFSEWGRLHADGQLVLRPNRFWTHPGSYWRLPHAEKDLFEDLKSSRLVIFKGDLNYRKLTGDAQWDPTTPFTGAIGPMGPGSGINVLSLRTCKADVVVGLKPGEDEKLRQTQGGRSDSGAREWAWNGKWAVASLSKGS